MMEDRVGIVFLVMVEDTLRMSTLVSSVVRIFDNEQSAVNYANMKNKAVGDKRYNYYPRSYGVFK